MSRVTLACLLALGVTSCGGRDRSGEFYTDWDRRGACQGDAPSVWGPTAEGPSLGPCEGHEGHFLWVSYAALWCSASHQQAGWLSAALPRFPQDSRLVVVLTSGEEVFTPATRSHAQAWARRYRLPPAQVVAEIDGNGSRTVPQHLLIGPDGRTWWRYVGGLDEQRMLDILQDFRSGRRQPVAFSAGR